MKLKKVLITGGSGFIGANLAHRLVSDGHRVHLFLRQEANTWRLDRTLKDLSVHRADIRDRLRTISFLKKIKPDWIFHLAAYGAYSSQDDLQEMLATNIHGTTSLVEAALQNNFEAFINVGSSSEYGLKDHPPKENELLDPNSHYAVTKAFATHFVRHTALKENRPMITLRPYSVYGPFEEPTRFIPTLIMTALEGKFPPLVSPNIARDFIYVDDFVEAMVQAAKKAKGFQASVYNVGTGKQTTIKAVVDLAVKIFKVKQKPRYASMPNRSWDTHVWVSDSQLIKKELGFVPENSFQEGFLKTVRWLLLDPGLMKFYKKKIEP